MKIGFVGANYTTKHLLNELSKSHDIVVWSSYKPDPPVSDAIRFHLTPRSWQWANTLKRRLKAQRMIPNYMKGLIPSLRAEQPDVLVVMDFVRLWYWQALFYAYRHPETKLILLSQTKRTPRALTSKLGYWLLLGVARLTQRRLHYVLTYHPDGTAYLRRHFHHVPITHFAFPILEDTPRYTEPTPGSTVKVLMPARFAGFKRHHDVIDAVEQLPRDTDIQIDFATFTNDSAPLREEITERVENSPQSDKLNVTDPIPKPFTNYHERLAHYDAVLLPSEYEGVGAVIPAALRSGRPAITSDTVGANIFMKDGQTGHIVPTGDVDTLAATLQTLDSNTLQKQGAAAAHRMREDFSADSCAQYFLELINPTRI